MNPDGTGLKNISHHRGTDDGPEWSPRGDKIAFISDREGDFDVYVSAVQGSIQEAPERLTESPGDDLWPVWSPDGTWIASISHRDGFSEIYIMRADGSRQRRMTRTSEEEKWLSWKP